MPNLLRRHPDDLSDLVAATDTIAQLFEVRVNVAAIEERLGPPEQRRLVALGRKASLDDGERTELERLVETAAPGLLQAAKDAREAQKRRVQERSAEAQGEPRRVLLEAGWAALPSGVLEDVLGGELEALDLAVLSVVALTIATGRIAPYSAASGGARFDGEVLVARGRGGRLLPNWDPGATSPNDRVISLRLGASLGRLEGREWLVVEREGDEVRLRPGERLVAA